MSVPPHDFDVHLLARIMHLIAPMLERSDALGEVIAAFNGVWHRLSACVAHEHTLVALLSDHDRAAKTRGLQEKELFELLVAGQSAVECLSYAMYRYASCLSQGKRFRTAVHNMHLRTTVNAFRRFYPSAVLTHVLAKIDASSEWNSRKKARSILVHRSYVGCHGNRTPVQWLKEEFGLVFSIDQRVWLMPAIHQALTASEQFIDMTSASLRAPGIRSGMPDSGLDQSAS